MKDFLLDKGDCVTLTYEINRDADAVTVRFLSVRIKLEKENKKKYGKEDKQEAFYFDRTGNFEKISFSGMVPEAFMVPSNVDYNRSKDGYFVLEGSTLSFSVCKGGEFKLSIPIYLAYQQKRTSYKLFNRFVLDLKAEAPAKNASAPHPTKTEAVSAVSSSSSPTQDNTMVLECVNNVKRNLPKQTSLPVAESLQADVDYLRQAKYNITDAEVRHQIDDVLEDFDQLKKDLQEEEKSAAQAAAQKQQEEALQAQIENQKREEERRAEEKEEAEKSRKRTLWMVIGGAALAVLSFVGNQVMQSLRASRGQKSMMEMQQNLTKRAEDEARRRAQDAIRSNTHKATNLAKEKAKGAIKDATGKIKNNKKKISI